MKKIYIIIMLILTGMIAEAQTSVWNGSRRLWTNGEGTESNPYLIESAENLAFLSYMVNKGVDTHGLYFALTTDIDLNGSEDLPWFPIGMGNRWFADDGCERIVDPSFKDNIFCGHFDGGGHSIYNLYVDGMDYAGLFGRVSNWYNEGVTIENVSIESGYINGTYSGGIVGECEGIVFITNCKNNAQINGTAMAGGIVGFGSKVIRNCNNTGQVNGKAKAGGIVGAQAKTITESFNSGDITIEGDIAGGIIGSSSSGLIIIKNCYNTGNLSGHATNGIGGIAGYIAGHSSEVLNCYNVGSLSNEGGATGGLFGNNSTNCTAENAYYLNTCGGWGTGTNKTAEEMRDPAFVDLLNYNTDVWAFDTDHVNDGYPILEGNTVSTPETTATAMTVYPNPVKDLLTLRFDDGTEPESVELYDLAGRLVGTKPNGLESIDMRKMPTGVYMLRVTMKDGTIYHEKVLKE